LVDDGLRQVGRETALDSYDAGCRALAKARSVDEVRDILDFRRDASPLRKRRKKSNLEADTFEIRDATERRLGDLMPHK
jgi:hypothetical protein